jgi:16S rRNA (cytosine967-C5)-methyltransferase
VRNKPARPERTRSSRWAPGAKTLADAAVVVSEVALGGRSLNFVPFERGSHPAAVRAVALGSIRWYLRLAPTVESLLTRPQGVPDEIRALLVVSAHQVEYSRNPVHATVLAAVDAARILKCPGTTGLVNAVLRRYLAEHESLLVQTDADLARRTAHPAWLANKIEQTWPQQYTQILTANNEHPPMVLRVDLTRRTREAYLAELHAAGIGARSVPWIDSAVQLERPVGVGGLPGFGSTGGGDGGTAGAAADDADGTDVGAANGAGRRSSEGVGVVSIQDAGAQLVPWLLAPQPGMRVLDACAAPGGKTLHLLEHTPDLHLVAVDIDAARVRRIDENLTRLGRTAQVMVGDLRDPTTFWDGTPFERILVDAPCSSTGVIRRHPDIKLLRKPGDIAAFAATQLQILRAAFGMLAPGGRLLYSTCSVMAEENQAVVAHLLECEPAARPVPMKGVTGATAELAPGAVSLAHGVQLLPGAEAGTDGFYYACLEKTTAGT